jgi:hypothetical protein
LAGEEEFKQARSLDVDIPLDTWGKVDDFIDDGIMNVPDLQDNRNRAIQALLLAIHTMCHPLSLNGPVVREDCLSLSKLVDEGQLSECLVILRWVINTRSLTIALPDKKCKHWYSNLKSIISSQKVSHKKLESVLGWLNHASTACPIMRYFLHRVRQELIS